MNYAFHEIDSKEGIWNSGKEEEPNLGHKPRQKEGYFPVPPVDSLQDLRTEMVLTLESLGIQVEAHHHEVATAGQGEIDMRFTTLTRMADNLMLYKYVVKNVARKHGMTATFMPKPLFEDNASGMHVHQSLWKGDTNLFYGDALCRLSELGRFYIGGLLKHAWALCGLCAPTTNSYRRLVPGYEAPINLVYSQRNRSACCRIPMYSPNPRAKRVEFRTPDPSCNGYLAFAAMLMAGLDGIDKRIDPGDPIDKNLYDLPPEEAKDVRSTPGSLRAGPRRAGGRPRLPARGRRLHQGRDRDLARLQAREGGRRHRAAPAPLRVPPLLRHLGHSYIFISRHQTKGSASCAN